MHFHCELMLQSDKSIDKDVESILEKYKEGNVKGKGKSFVGVYDNYGIGGRYEKAHSNSQGKDVGNVLPFNRDLKDFKCNLLIVRDMVFTADSWGRYGVGEVEFDGYVVKKLKELGIDNGFLVTIDYHF